MSSTRNKNTQVNYALEKQRYLKSHEYSMYSNVVPNLDAGNGLIHGQVPAIQLSKNYIDIESFLRGTNTTDLENGFKIITPQLNTLSTLHIYEKSPIILPPRYKILQNRPIFWS